MMKKRLLSCLIAASLIFAAIPSAVFAEEDLYCISDEKTDIVDSDEETDIVDFDEETAGEDSYEEIITESVTLEDTFAGSIPDDETLIEADTLGEHTNYTISRDETGSIFLRIGGKGVIEGTTSGDYPWDTYHTSISDVIFYEGITEIPENCFSSFTNLSVIEFPASLEKIDDFAFAYCTSLEELYFTDNIKIVGDYAFTECTNLGILFLNDSLLSIGTGAFYKCTRMDCFTLGPNLVTLGVYALGDCTDLRAVTVYNKDTVFKHGEGIYDHPFSGDADIIFFGYEGSRAETFAAVYGYKFCYLDPVEYHPEPLTEITQLPSVTSVSLSEETPRRYYSFTAEEDDYYIIRNYLSEGTPASVAVPSMYLQDADGNYLETTNQDTWMNGYNEMHYPVLEAGKLYYVTVYLKNDTVPVDSTLYISQMNPVIDPESDSLMVTVFHNRDAVYSFIPDKTGWYSFESKSCEMDPAITIKKGDAEIGSNDNVSADDNNFSLNVYLTAGTEYSVDFGSADQSTGLYEVSIKYGKPFIVLQPSFAKGGVGSRIEFHIDVENVKSFQWQYQKAGTTKWITSTATGSTTDTLSLKISSTNKTNLYRCKMVGNDGSIIYSDPAGIDLIPAAKITKQPESQAIMQGDYACFSVEAENISLVTVPYQWQYSKDGVNWYNSSATGSRTNTLSVKSSKTNRSYYYRCVITGLDGNKKTTSKVGMVILTKGAVPCTGKEGVTAEFSVKTDEAVSYQWQYSKDYSKWYNSSASGSTTDTMQLKESASNMYNSYRCRLTRADGITAYTRGVGFNSNTWIETLPESVTAGSAKTVSFIVVANGVENYQWQWSKDGKTWTTCTAAASDESTLTVPVNAANKTYQYRCRLEDYFGGVVYTNVVKIN